MEHFTGTYHQALSKKKKNTLKILWQESFSQELQVVEFPLKIIMQDECICQISDISKKEFNKSEYTVIIEHLSIVKWSKGFSLTTHDE